MPRKTFVGFGFGAIQGGLFLYEAYQSGNFDRLVVAEVVPEVVSSLRRADGRYRVNVATRSSLQMRHVEGVEVFNPNDPHDRAPLVAAVAEANELATALPSVEFYDKGTASVAAILAEGLAGRSDPGVLYAAENNNQAAEILKGKVGTAPENFQFLNTVIGKMSGVVGEGRSREFLVEEFNRILISQITVPGFRRGIEVFEEKPDLLPFEEAKLYGHNAVHALLGFLAHKEGRQFLSEASRNLRRFAREAFIEESGRALIAKHGGVDELFTSRGFEQYAADLLERMFNPFLKDAVARVIRDPRRKLGWNDRLIGTMRLALDVGIVPHRFAKGAAAALATVGGDIEACWSGPDVPPGRKNALKELIARAGETTAFQQDDKGNKDNKGSVAMWEDQRAPELQFVDNPMAPDIFADGLSGYFLKDGNVRMTFETVRESHVSSPGSMSRIVIGRLVMPIDAAENMARGVLDFIQKTRSQSSPTA
jgi:mannitol-1-phosphate 5-dehydrogenase